MGRHNTPKEKGISSIQKAREKELLALVELAEKNREHLIESMSATRICTYCNVDGSAPKQDKEGKCLQCHGKNVIPDVARRDWAYDEIESRIAPKPKAVEMTSDATSEAEEEQELKEKSTAELEQMLENLSGKNGKTEG